MKTNLKKKLVLMIKTIGVSMLFLIMSLNSKAQYRKLVMTDSYYSVISGTSIYDPYAIYEGYQQLSIQEYTDWTCTTPVLIPASTYIRLQTQVWEYLYQDFNYAGENNIATYEIGSAYAYADTYDINIGWYKTWYSDRSDSDNGNYVSYDYFIQLME